MKLKERFGRFFAFVEPKVEMLANNFLQYQFDEFTDKADPYKHVPPQFFGDLLSCRLA